MDKTAKFLKDSLEDLGFDFLELDKASGSMVGSDKDAGVLDCSYYKDLVETAIKALSEVASLGDWELLGVVMLLKKWYKKKLEEEGHEKPIDWVDDPDDGSLSF